MSRYMIQSDQWANLGNAEKLLVVELCEPEEEGDQRKAGLQGARATTVGSEVAEGGEDPLTGLLSGRGTLRGMQRPRATRGRGLRNIFGAGSSETEDRSERQTAESTAEESETDMDLG